MIKIDMKDPVICDNCIFCRENSNTGTSECILKLPNHYEVDIHSKDENCPIIAVEEGEWIFDKEFTEFGNPYGTYRCSICGGHSSDKYSFCKDCGADMRGSSKEITFDDYLKEQLKDPEFRKKWEKLLDEEKQKGGKE